MLARMLAQELTPDGLRVNTVLPGMVRTGMAARVYADELIAADRAALVPLRRIATLADLADAVDFPLGPDARYLSDHGLVVDGGVIGSFFGCLHGLSEVTGG